MTFLRNFLPIRRARALVVELGCYIALNWALLYSQYKLESCKGGIRARRGSMLARP